MKFNKHEIAVVTEARANDPKMSQRGLATKIHNEDYWRFATTRTVASIYSVVRRTDRAAKLALAAAKPSRRETAATSDNSGSKFSR